MSKCFSKIGEIIAIPEYTLAVPGKFCLRLSLNEMKFLFSNKSLI